MRYVFHPEALTEYAEAVQYYAAQRVEVVKSSNGLKDEWFCSCFNLLLLI